jgi:hypothetical protein
MRALRVTRPIGTGHEAEADGAGPEQSGHDCLFMKGSARDYRRGPRRVLRMAAAAAWDARCASRTRAHAAVSFRAAPQPRALPRPRLTAAHRWALQIGGLAVAPLTLLPGLSAAFRLP